MDRRPTILSTLSLALAVVGILSAIWFYYAGKRDRRLSYSVATERTRIVNASDVGLRGLGLTYKGEPVLDSDVTSITVYIWNEGRESVRRESILLPIQIELGEGASILDCQLLRSTRTKITEFASPSYSAGSRRVSLDWKILERGDGAAIQVIFCGPYDAPVSITGVVEGQAALEEVTPKPLPRENTPLAGELSWIFPLTAALAFLVSTLIAVRASKRGIPLGRHGSVTLQIMAFMLLLAISLSIYKALGPAIPPSLAP